MDRFEPEAAFGAGDDFGNRTDLRGPEKRVNASPSLRVRLVEVLEAIGSFADEGAYLHPVDPRTR